MEAVYVEGTDEDVCPECDSTRLVMDYVRGEEVCEVCGLVVRDRYIDKGPEWTNREGVEGSSSRVGSPTSISTHDRGLTTEISPGTRDSKGNRLQTNDGGRLQRLRKLQKQMRYSRAGERSLADALIELDRMASVMEIPEEFRREAAMIYRRAASKGLVRGRTIKGMASASIYIACRVMLAPRTLDEISELLEVEKRELSLSFKVIARGLKLGLPTPRAEDYLGRVASRLNLPMDVQAEALDLMRRAEKAERFHSKSPMGTVAACIYLASLKLGMRVSQERISSATGVSEVTIRVRYTAITEALGLDVAPRGVRLSPVTASA